MRRAERGFTLVEVAFAGVLFTVLMGAVATAVATDTRAERVLLSDLVPEMKARIALEKIAGELRSASKYGEDPAGTGLYTAALDLNENGVLDANWNLEDKAADQPTLTFNRRIDIRFDESEVVSTTVYSRAITYRLEGDRLVRETIVTNFATGTVRAHRTDLGRGFAGLRFSRDGDVVTVSLDVTLALRGGPERKRSLTRRILVRD